MYKEFCADFNKRYGTMIPVTRDPATGYCSVYWFSEADAKEIRSSGNSQGLAKYRVYSDKLWFDFDGGEEEFQAGLAKIKGLKAPYAVFFSGKKGYHVAVDIVPMEGYDVPAQQKQFVESLAISCDLSLYRHDRILSNVGRVHPSTGKKKELLYRVDEGEAFTIPRTLVVKKQPIPIDDTSLLKFGLLRALILSENTPRPGNRHTALWSCAKTMCDAGLSYETVLDVMTKINEQFKTPKEPQDVERAVAQAFQMEYEITYVAKKSMDPGGS